jgi:hypothetical protein
MKRNIAIHAGIAFAFALVFAVAQPGHGPIVNPTDPASFTTWLASWITNQNHNSLTNIQGGATAEYYHFKSSEWTLLTNKVVLRASYAPSSNQWVKNFNHDGYGQLESLTLQNVNDIYGDIRAWSNASDVNSIELRPEVAPKIVFSNETTGAGASLSYAPGADTMEVQGGNLQVEGQLYVEGNIYLKASSQQPMATSASVADDEIMAYDSASGTWTSQTPVEAGIATTAHTHALSDMTNPDKNWTNNFANKTWRMNFSNPAGGIDMNVTGGFSGDMFRILQETGNPGADTHLIHLEATDTDVTTLHSKHNGAGGVAGVFEGRVGIGTNAPAVPLHVTGAAQVDGELTNCPNLEWVTGGGFLQLPYADSPSNLVFIGEVGYACTLARVTPYLQAGTAAGHVVSVAQGKNIWQDTVVTNEAAIAVTTGSVNFASIDTAALSDGDELWFMVTNVSSAFGLKVGWEATCP